MIFGGTFVLAYLVNVAKYRACGGAEVCNYCDAEIRWEFRNWLTDQAIKQGLRSDPDAGEGVS